MFTDIVIDTNLQLLSSIVLVTDCSIFFFRSNLFPRKNNQCRAMGHVCWQIRKEALHRDQHSLSVCMSFLQTRCQITPGAAFSFSWSEVNLALIFFRVVLNTLFGLSTSYWMAIVTRGLLGLLCGILGPIKVTRSVECWPWLSKDVFKY
jgi:hypothetical protein